MNRKLLGLVESLRDRLKRNDVDPSNIRELTCEVRNAGVSISDTQLLLELRKTHPLEVMYLTVAALYEISMGTERGELSGDAKSPSFFVISLFTGGSLIDDIVPIQYVNAIKNEIRDVFDGNVSITVPILKAYMNVSDDIVMNLDESHPIVEGIYATVLSSTRVLTECIEELINTSEAF